MIILSAFNIQGYLVTLPIKHVFEGFRAGSPSVFGQVEVLCCQAPFALFGLAITHVIQTSLEFNFDDTSCAITICSASRFSLSRRIANISSALFFVCWIFLHARCSSFFNRAIRFCTDGVGKEMNSHKNNHLILPPTKSRHFRRVCDDVTQREAYLRSWALVGLSN